MAGYMNFELPCGICPTYDAFRGICKSDTIEIWCHFKPVIDRHKDNLDQFSISYLFETDLMLNNTTRCLKLIFLCQCVRLQAILNTSEPTLSHSNVAGNFLRGHFLPYSKTHGFFVGCENVHDLRSQFARTFHLTVCLGQETVSFFEKNDQL